MLTGKLISVVVACYRDGGNVREMYSRLTSVLPQVSSSYEIIFVNDNSPDNAEELLLEIAGQDAHVTVISHSRNFGSQMAFTSGMRQSLGDAVILMDGDLQDPPETIPVLIAEWTKGYDVVYGVRDQRVENPLMESARKLFYRLYRRLSYIDVPVDAGDFSVMSRRVVDAMLQMPERDRFLRGLRTRNLFLLLPAARIDFADGFDGHISRGSGHRHLFHPVFRHPQRAARLSHPAGGRPVARRGPVVQSQYYRRVSWAGLRRGQAAPAIHRAVRR